MRTVNYLTLPGGFSLPAALVTDTYFPCETADAPRENWGPLEDAARRIVRERMIAGEVLSEDKNREGNRLTAVYDCRELLGVFRPGVYMERDSNERENRER